MSAQTSRRGLLRGTLALSVAAVPITAIAATGTDAELLAHCRAFQVASDELREGDATPGGWPDNRVDAAVARYWAAVDGAMFMRPRSAEGMRAKLAMAHLLEFEMREQTCPSARSFVLAALSDALGREYPAALMDMRPAGALVGP